MNRKELKKEAREYAFNHKWLIWQPLLIIYAITFCLTFISTFATMINEGFGAFVSFIVEFAIAGITPLLMVSFITYLRANIRGNNKDYKSCVDEHKKSWLNYFMTSLMVEIYVFLWTLLLIVPGIIKAIEYSQVYMILSENPNMDWKEAIDKSKKMMEGHRMDYFLLILSFIGWGFLVVFTLGIAAIWVIPYIETTNVKFYEYLTGNNIILDAEIHHVNTCPYCGQETNEDSKYCPKCGSQIK